MLGPLIELIRGLGPYNHDVVCDRDLGEGGGVRESRLEVIVVGQKHRRSCGDCTAAPALVARAQQRGGGQRCGRRGHSIVGVGRGVDGVGTAASGRQRCGRQGQN